MEKSSDEAVEFNGVPILIICFIGVVLFVGTILPEAFDADYARDVCFDLWESEVFGENYSVYRPVKFVSDRAVKISENKYVAAVVFYKNYEQRTFSCNVVKRNNGRFNSVFRNGGLNLKEGVEYRID